MLDFTSALYLGMFHPTRSLKPWTSLTTGVPAALAEPAGMRKVSAQLAALQGLEHAVLFPSSLHAFWDIFTLLAESGHAIYLDAGSYPIAKWGSASAVTRGATVCSFRHHDVRSLKYMLRRDKVLDQRPVIVTDGFYPSCGRFAPLMDYSTAVRKRGGLLLIDDTQAIGIFGRNPGPGRPHGTGGGGSLPWHGLYHREILSVSSLAKAFGVPIAVAAGSRSIIRRFQKRSQTRVHCSPPSLAALRASEHALALNRSDGSRLRGLLGSRIRLMRARMAAEGFKLNGRLFPVQTLKSVNGSDSKHLYRNLLEQGVQTVLRAGHLGDKTRISFIITARHTNAQINRAIPLIANAAKSVVPLSATG